MEELNNIIESLQNTVNYIKNITGNEDVKNISQTCWNWIKNKFTKKSEQTKLENFENDPDSLEMQQNLKNLINDAIIDDEINFEEIKEQTDAFEKILKEKDPQWANQYITKTNTLNVNGNNNNVFSDINGSTITLNNK
ncbi:hypothetical protein [Aureivirga marina]|uniref:hypothetical protein n=1 Tax=Aureivirga marina TaxID=1182451 RepID=UPI0018CAAFD6|nr:hypothetical protein [Aureivirga marina]